MRIFVCLVLYILCAVAVAPSTSQRIVGGSVTTIETYPEMAALLISWGTWFQQTCGGTIINNRSVLTAAHCFRTSVASEWRMRIGSSFASSGGTVHTISQIIRHPSFSTSTFDNDIAILRSGSNFIFSNAVASASIASSNYNLADNQVVWAAGWGLTNYIGSSSEQLRHVQIWTINQAVCRNSYASIRTVTDNMLCSGWIGVGGRDQCQGDSGGPLFHNKVVVGVCSWGHRCGEPNYPGVNARVSRYTSWIQSNA